MVVLPWKSAHHWVLHIEVNMRTPHAFHMMQCTYDGFQQRNFQMGFPLNLNFRRMWICLFVLMASNFISLCVCLDICLCVWAHVNGYVEITNQLSILFHHSPHYIIIQSLSLKLELAMAAILADQWVPVTLQTLPLQYWGYRLSLLNLTFYMTLRDQTQLQMLE